jgi:hypothetical protein
MNKTRRDFLKFLGVSTYGLTSFAALTSCSFTPDQTIKGQFPSYEDKLLLTPGLQYYPIISWGEITGII